MIDTACEPIQYTQFGVEVPVLIAHATGGRCDQGEYFAKMVGGDYGWIAPSRFGFLGTPLPNVDNSSI